MKKIIYLLFAATLSVAIIGCNKEETPEETCNNNKRDNGETEIDCGGECEPCPFPATLTASVEGLTYVANTAGGSQQGNGISVSSSGTGGGDLFFVFSGVTENTSLPITGASVDVGDDYFVFEITDTGHVVITSHDQVRKIISGRFSFSARDYYNSNNVGLIQNGTFENVRYSN